MGRTKSSPSKKDISLGSVSLSTIGEFIPICKNRRSKKIKKAKNIYYQLTLVKEYQRQYYIGDICIGSPSTIVPEIMHDPCKVCFNCNEEENSIIICTNNDYIIIQAHNEAELFKDLLRTKVFCFEMFAHDQNIYAKVYLQAVPLPKCSSFPKLRKCIQRLFKTFFGIDAGVLDLENEHKGSTLTTHELEHVYEKLIEKQEISDYPLYKKQDLVALRPCLRPYQEKALNWMLHRETKVVEKDHIHPLYQKVELKSGCIIYLDIYNGWIEVDPPIVKNQWKGGILADEMGLGKTVEVLGLILCHRYNNIPIQPSSEDKELVIVNQKKKRKIVIGDEDQANEDIPAKKISVSESQIDTSTKKKGSTFTALQSIYNRVLSEYCTTEVRNQPPKCNVQCICGNTAEIGCVRCVECDKLQHRSCLGYKEHLGPYKCPQCWDKCDPIESKATLIVAPVALRKQWCREMRNHLKDGLKVLNYQGYSETPVYPTELQEYDIVITTYNVLQAELRLTKTSSSLNLRNQRKYWPGGSPLVRLHWWRLCLDEAQTVESPGSLVSLMASKIPAFHRWAVTGTPMAKGVSDIFGLIEYLQMEPYSDFNTWNHILYKPYVRGVREAMHDFLSKVLWRTSKRSVLDQINIPPQSQEMHVLEFSAVEKFFYSREHEICANDLLYVASKFDPDLHLESMDKRSLKNLMAPLLALRQACSDPSSVRGKGRYLSLKKNVSSMKDLLDALIARNKSDCEESLRLMISAINGLAGIYLLMRDPEQAIHEYRKVLQLGSQFSQAEKEGKLVIDTLPLIHAMHNLAEVLSKFKPKDRTLRDDCLTEDCAKLEKLYIEKFMKETAIGVEQCAILTNTVIKHQKVELIGKYGQWYSDGFDWVSSNNLDNDLISRVEIASDNANISCDIRLTSETTRMMLRRVYDWHHDLDESRDYLYTAINALYEYDPDTKTVHIAQGLVQKAMDCHLRPQKSKNNKKKVAKCPVCKANDRLKDYELKLYTMKKRGQDFEDMGLEGSWKPRLEELMLRSLLGLIKSKSYDPADIKHGETHMLLIEAMKKEFKAIRRVWTLLDQQTCAQDELDICKVRLQFKTGNESTDSSNNRTLKNLRYDLPISHEHINLITPAELPHQELSLLSEETKQNARLESLLGTRNYLGTLRQQQFEGFTPDPCPVCRGPLVNTWAILSCAHTYCMDCFETLLTKDTARIQCCVCRARHKLHDVAYINNRVTESSQEQPQNEAETFVVGNYSRKVDAVVRLLLSLRKDDPQVKILLFSTWFQVLKILKQALDRNDINAELADTGAALFEKHIEAFKDPLRKVTVLLLPVRLGAKGLNLIEATHVILLEPLLNPADELQAIGRVHRIGQTKPTVVHRFLIRNTIEESLFNATSSNASDWEKGKVTVSQLSSLFVSHLEEVNETQECSSEDHEAGQTLAESHIQMEPND